MILICVVAARLVSVFVFAFVSVVLVADILFFVFSYLAWATALVFAFMQNLTVGQNIIFAAPSHIRHRIASGRAFDAHRRALFDLQMSAGANVMNPRWHCKENKQRRENTLEMAGSEIRKNRNKKQPADHPLLILWMPTVH